MSRLSNLRPQILSEKGWGATFPSPRPTMLHLLRGAWVTGTDFLHEQTPRLWSGRMANKLTPD